MPMLEWIIDHWQELTLNTFLYVIGITLYRHLFIKKFEFIIRRYYPELIPDNHAITHKLLAQLIEMQGGTPCVDLNSIKNTMMDKGNIFISFWAVLFPARAVTKSIHYRRSETMKNFVKALGSSLSKKLVAFIITAVVTALNGKFNLNIDPNGIYGLYGLAIAYILGQSHVDAKKAISNAINATSQVAAASSIPTQGNSIKTIISPPMSFSDMEPYINEVHTEINNLYNQIQSGKYNDSVQQAASIYMTLHEYLVKAGGKDASKGSA